MKRKWGVIIFWLVIFAGAFILLRSVIGDHLLKKNGKCTKAILIDEQNRVRSHKATLLYEFSVGAKKYKGNSLEEDLKKVRDTVCVIYLGNTPSINKPIKYFNTREIKCNCDN